MIPDPVAAWIVFSALGKRAVAIPINREAAPDAPETAPHPTERTNHA